MVQTTDEKVHWRKRSHKAKTTDTQTYDNLKRIFYDLADLFRPPDRITVTEAMERHIRLNNAGSYIGPYKAEIAPYMQEPADTLASRHFTSCVFVGPAQTGKALSIYTPIATPTGWRRMGALQVGDWVYGDDGKPCRIIAVSEVMRGHTCYRVVFDDGTDIVADAEHMWAIRDDYSEKETITTTEDMAQAGIKYGIGNRRFRFSIANAAPITGAQTDLPIDPYTLGCWLGDGNSYASWITTHREDKDELADRIHAAGYAVITAVQQENTYTIKIDPKSLIGGGAISIRDHLYDLGLIRGKGRTTDGNGKHIPSIYLRSSVVQRQELLRGLMDTDGWVTKTGGVCGYGSSEKRLIDGVYELLVSLGFKVRRRTKETTYTYKGERRKGAVSYTVSFVTYAENFVPFHLKRKKTNVRSRLDCRPSYSGRRRIEAIEEVASVPVKCIGVDNASHLYLAGEQMVPTHNTEALILGWIAYSAVVDPMDLIVYSPTQASARDFSMRRVDRLHRNSPDIGARLLTNRDSNNKFDKHYRSGMMLTLAWPSVTEFAGKPVGRIALTDFDRMPDDIEGDGNPFDLASKRTTTFKSFAMTMAESSPSRDVENPKWIKTTPHEAPPCKGILGLYNRGDRRRWYWPCPKCGSYFEGKWSQLEWETRSTILDSAETARLVAPCCGYKIGQDERPEMQRWGTWLKDGQGIGVDGRIVGEGIRSPTASFWMNGVAAAFTTWTNLVTTYLTALQQFQRTGSEDELRKFYNTDLGEPYMPKSLETERLPEVLKARAEALPYEEGTGEERIDRATSIGVSVEPLVPTHVRFLVASLDVQNNMFIAQVHGISPGDPFDITVIDRFTIKKSRRLDLNQEHLWVKPATHLDDWDEITTEVLDRSYKLADGSGRRMMIRYTVCDSAGRPGATTNAYNYYRKLKAEGKAGRFHLVKGDGLPSRPRAQITFPDSNRRDKLAAARGDVPVMILNSNALKDALSARLDTITPGTGMFRFPSWAPDWFFSELCAEIRTDRGWTPTNFRRNEAWDLGYYCIGACVSVMLRVEGIDWSKPPGWAAEHAVNDLVFKPTGAVGDKPFDRQAVPMDFSDFGRSLG